MAAVNVLASRRHKSVTKSQAHLNAIGESLKIEFPPLPRGRKIDAEHELTRREVYVEQVLRLIREQIVGDVPDEEVPNLIADDSGKVMTPTDNDVEETDEEVDEASESPEDLNDDVPEEASDVEVTEPEVATEETETEETTEGEETKEVAIPADDPMLGNQPLSYWSGLTDEQFAKHPGLNKVIRKKIKDALEAQK